MVEVAERGVQTWEDILAAGGAAGKKPRTVKWLRGDETLSAIVTPVNDLNETEGSLGCRFERYKQRIRKHGLWGSVKTGLFKTYSTVAEVVLFVRGLARRDVSGKQVGSIVVIAYVSYLAAQEGIGKLLYLTAMISAALAILNILPIPILDGGHLLFVTIEKVRGKPVSEKVMAISQYVGLTLVLALVIFAVANDVMRIIR